VLAFVRERLLCIYIMAETINYIVKHVILSISTYSMNEPQSASLIENYTVCVLYNTDSVLVVE